MHAALRRSPALAALFSAAIAAVSTPGNAAAATTHSSHEPDVAKMIFTCSDATRGIALIGWCETGNFIGPIHVGSLFYAEAENNFIGLVQGGWVNVTEHNFYGLLQYGAVNSAGAEMVRKSNSQATKWSSVITEGEFIGLAQIGTYNMAGNFQGLLQYGLMNEARRFRGLLQLGIIYNRGVDVLGIQSGFWSETKVFRGIGISAVAIQETTAGAQFGLVAWSDDFTGIQAAGFNRADKMAGVQLGVVNFARELKGFQLGVLNINLNGKLPVMPILNANL